MNRERQLNLGEGVHVEVIDASLATPLEHAKAIAKERTLSDCDEPFFVADLSAVAAQLRRWRSRLPRVEPFYAVKCNDDVAVLRTLAQLGVGFDCTSKPELRRVLQLGVSPDRIIYANPCKLTSMIRFARDSEVPLMTFDNADELYKIKEHFPEAKLVLRIQPQPVRGRARNSLGKFGAPYDSVARLIRTAKSLALDVVGVSFHVGSACQDAQQYVHALRLARRVFDDLLAVGYTPYLVDIGGGFPGTDDVSLSFDEVADALAPALDQLFPPTSDVRLIAEPGRFMVARAFLLMVNVIAKRTVDASSPDTQTFSASTTSCTTTTDASRFLYYLNDGVYGSFNFLLFDQRTPSAHVAKRVSPTAPRFSSCLYGPTCDSLDCVVEDSPLPELFVGDWLYFENMGAYTLASSPDFSSMPRAERFYLVNKSDALLFRRELAALIAENGSPTSDLATLLDDSFFDEVRTAADVAQHELALQLQLNSAVQLRDELKSVLREFHDQTDAETDCAIVQLETFLSAFATAEQESPDSQQPTVHAESAAQNACESDNSTRCESVSANAATASKSASTASGDEPHTLADEPAVTLIFD